MSPNNNCFGEINTIALSYGFYNVANLELVQFCSSPFMFIARATIRIECVLYISNDFILLSIQNRL